MATNSSTLTGVGNGPSIKEAMNWLAGLMQQGVDPNTRLEVKTTPYINQFEAGSWSVKCQWEKP